MKNQLIRWQMKILITAFALLLSGLVAAKPLDKIVVFGDSLSDNGNLYVEMNKKLPQSPPYYDGRFSNGPVWVEHLAKAYFPNQTAEHFFDYAYGGAGISEDPDEDVLHTLNREINEYFHDHGEMISDDTLFIVWIGANNYLGVPDDAEAVTTMVNDGIVAGLKRLVNAGAKHIVVANLPDLGKTPIAIAFHTEEKLSYITTLHNDLLTANLASLRQEYPDVQWLSYDVYKTFNELLTNPTQYGLTNITETCYELPMAESSNREMLRMAAKIKPKQGKDVCQGYLFFDPVHPTGPVHKVMSEHAKSFLDEATKF